MPDTTASRTTTASTSTAAFPENVVVAPPSGERFVFKRGADVPAGVCAFDFYLAPGGGVPMAHTHARQDEIFRCRRGQLSVTVNGEPRTLGPGDELVLPAGTFHTLLNRSAEECHCEVEYRPAGKNEAWFKIAGALTWKLGREPGFFYIVPFINDVDIYIQGPPRWLQRALFATLKPFAILLGYRRRARAAVLEAYGQPLVW